MSYQSLCPCIGGRPLHAEALRREQHVLENSTSHGLKRPESNGPLGQQA